MKYYYVAYEKRWMDGWVKDCTVVSMADEITIADMIKEVQDTCRPKVDMTPMGDLLVIFYSEITKKDYDLYKLRILQ